MTEREAHLRAAMRARLVVTVCVPLSLDPVPAIQEVGRRLGVALDVRYPQELLPAQRFPADHKGEARPDGQSGTDDPRWRPVLRDANIALGFPGDGPAGIAYLHHVAPQLQWIQGTAAGAGEQLVASGVIDERLEVTSAAGIHATPLAEFALCGLLALDKDLTRIVRASDRAEWLGRWPMRTLRNARVLVVGLGGVGREVARLAAAFGAEVIGCRRGHSDSLPAGVTRVVGLDEVDEMLPGIDAVVVTLPGTQDTRGWLDARRLGLLPSHAVVVNVGRGSVVDSAALAAALDRGELRGAALDVTDIEPLPRDSPLWGRDDVLLSPHTAALTSDEDDRLLALFCDNLERFLTGQPLLNIIDASAGY